MENVENAIKKVGEKEKWRAALEDCVDSGGARQAVDGGNVIRAERK